MSIELFSILLLLLMFVAAAIKPINLGVMGIVAAFLLGTIGGGLTVDEIFGGSRVTSSYCLQALRCSSP